MQVDAGSVEQIINHITINVCCHYRVEETYYEKDEDGEEYERTRIIRCVATLAKYKVTGQFTTEVNQQKRFDFEITLPVYSPLSFGDAHIWLHTDLDIASAIDKSDKDTLNVLPTARQQLLFNAMEDLGFSLVEVECEEGRQLGQPFIQEFEFKPRRGPFRGKVDEVEVLMVSHDDCLEVLIEIDRRSRGFSGFFQEVFDRDESKLWLDIEDTEQEAVTALLEEVIADHC